MKNITKLYFISNIGEYYYIIPTIGVTVARFKEPIGMSIPRCTEVFILFRFLKLEIGVMIRKLNNTIL